MKKSKKLFRLNVIISYHKSVNADSSRHLFQSILKGFAYLYYLDYTTDDDTQAFGDVGSDLFSAHDLFYFRSTDLTPVDLNLKRFQKIILDVFFCYHFLSEIEVSYQLQKYLREYPFPKHFFRPLKYPCIEEHKDDRSDLLVHAEALSKVMQSV